MWHLQRWANLEEECMWGYESLVSDTGLQLVWCRQLGETSSQQLDM